MLQPFDTRGRDNLAPMQLNPQAKALGNQQLDFLAFKNTVLPPKAVEYNRASDAKAMSIGQKLDTAWGGKFDMFYKDVANPYAYGVDYNMDFGGKTEHNKGVLGMELKKKEKMAAYVKNMVNKDYKYDNFKPPVMKNAYDQYGYQELGFKSGKNEKLSAIMTRDLDMCPAGNMWVDGYCVPVEKPECPYGWELNDKGMCTLSNKQL